MSAYQILESSTPESIAKTSGKFYIKDENVFVQSFGDGTLVLVDLDNAMTPGKQCRRISMENASRHDGCAVINLAARFGTFAAFMAYCEDRKNPTPGVDVYVSTIQSKRVFSPFGTLNPIKDRPKKWTIAHVARALFNGQGSVRVDMVLTDDYAHDAAVNFQKGDADAMAFCRELIEHPSGWRVWVDDKAPDALCVACHSFEYRTVHVNI